MHIIIKKAAIYLPKENSEAEQNRLSDILHNLAKDRGFLIYKEYREKNDESSTKISELQRLLAAAQKRELDVLLVNNLNSLGKTLLTVNRVLGILYNSKIDLIAIENGLETEKNRDLIYRIIESMVSFESQTKSRLIRAGQENALHKGRKLGRPRLPLVVYRQAMDLRALGRSYRRIGSELNIDESTIRKWVKKQEKNKTK